MNEPTIESITILFDKLQLRSGEGMFQGALCSHLGCDPNDRFHQLVQAAIDSGLFRWERDWLKRV